MRFVSEWLFPLIAVSVVYIIALFVSFYLLFPFTAILSVNHGHGVHDFYAHLIFLPHGVRVITAWFYGWRSVLFLTPPSLFANLVLNGGTAGFELETLAGVLVGIICGALAFQILVWSRVDTSTSGSSTFSWRTMLLAGAIASLINSLGANSFYGAEMGNSLFLGTATYLVGDVCGLFFLLIFLMFVFRFIRLAANRKVDIRKLSDVIDSGVTASFLSTGELEKEVTENYSKLTFSDRFVYVIPVVRENDLRAQQKRSIERVSKALRDNFPRQNFLYILTAKEKDHVFGSGGPELVALARELGVTNVKIVTVEPDYSAKSVNTLEHAIEKGGLRAIGLQISVTRAVNLEWAINKMKRATLVGSTKK